MGDTINTVYVYSNETKESKDVAERLKSLLKVSGFNVPEEYTDEVQFVVSVGGDGTFMKALRTFGFPPIPFLGVNTGHLGFFEELQPDELDKIPVMIKNGDYVIQNHSLLRCLVGKGGGMTEELYGITDMIVRTSYTKVSHLSLTIGDCFVENFSGDGILVASSAGSTAYNYSLGGSIVDPRVDLLQITPIAPMNTNVFRSATSSMLVPPGVDIRVIPDPEFRKDGILIVDGVEYLFDICEYVEFFLSEREISLVRLGNYDFWTKVMSKFL